MAGEYPRAGVMDSRTRRWRGLRPVERRIATRVREGRFQGVLAGATAASAILNGVESLYSHYKTNLRYRAQWISSFSLRHSWPQESPRSSAVGAARYALASLSLLAVASGGVGLFYHARGVARRPGGMKQPVYSLRNGPPVFAPLLYWSADSSCC
jgi:hypothetical protein